MSFEQINIFAKQRKPFLFISDFKGEKVEVVLLEELQKEDIEFCIDENYTYIQHSHRLETIPIKFSEYKKNLTQSLRR